MEFKNYLESIAGVATYPIISLLVFVLFFAVLTIRVLRMRKEVVHELENLPLSDSTLNEK